MKKEKNNYHYDDFCGCNPFYTNPKCLHIYLDKYGDKDVVPEDAKAHTEPQKACKGCKS